MSDESKDQGGFDMYSSAYDSSLSQSQVPFDPSYMSLSECLQLGDYNSFATSFGSLSPSLEAFSSAGDQLGNCIQKPPEGGHFGSGSGGKNIPVTQNSSLSSSSNSEAGAEEDSGKSALEDHNQKVKEEGGEERSTKGKKGKKNGEKKEKEPRFAFMTKSEVDQLEDGYRWRKYGQKAVKNSPYPRSYYRCTTQKCRVKKRVERSFEDPTTVITTYEGQHNHPVPTSLRSNYNSSSYIFTPSSSSSLGHVRSPQDWLLLHSSMPHGHGASNANSNHNNLHSYLQQQQQQQQNRQYHHLQLLPNASHDDYGLLQDIIPSSMFLKPQPRGQ